MADVANLFTFFYRDCLDQLILLGVPFLKQVRETLVFLNQLLDNVGQVDDVACLLFQLSAEDVILAVKAVHEQTALLRVVSHIRNGL